MSIDRGGERGVRVAPVGDADLDEVGGFLHTFLNPRISAAGWAAAARPTWQVDAPNHGFLLRDAAGAVVGVQLAFYADREVAGRAVRFCNLAAWCVRPEHRGDGLRLLRAVLAQPGYHFTDLSPSGAVVALNERLRFQHLDTTVTLAPNLPLPGGGTQVLTAVDRIEAHLRGAELRILRDHRDSAAARHVLLRGRGGEQCYVVYRRDRRKRLPLFASLLHVSDPPVLARHRRALGRHLLRHGALLTLAELRVVGSRPAGALTLRRARPKMYRSPDLPPDAVDDLYSELTAVAW